MTPAAIKTAVHTIGPDGTVFKGLTSLDTTTCCVVWAWSNSCQAWLVQTGFVPYLEAGRAMAALTSECPNVRVVFTPARES